MTNMSIGKQLQTGTGILAVLVLTFPWLNPVANGPYPAAIPWLTSMASVGLFLLLITIRRIALVPVLAVAWMSAALISSGFGLLQYAGAITAPGTWINGTVAGEAFANLRQRNQFATLLNIGLVALLYCVGIRSNRAASGSERPTVAAPSWMRMVCPVAAATLLGAGLAASSSRTGMLQLGLLPGLLLAWRCWHRKPVRWTLLSGMSAYLLAAYLLPRLSGLDPATSGILARLQAGDPACSSRLVLWGNVLDLIAAKPWSGWGWGELDYAHFMTLYSGARFCDILDNAHNLPLQLAVELGVPFAFVVCVWTAWSIGRAVPWREANPARQLAWAVLFLILLHSLLEYPLWYGPFQISAALCVWVLWSTRSRAVHAGPAGLTRSPGGVWIGPGSARLGALTACMGMAILLAAGYALWDYRRVSQIYLTTSQRAPAYRDNTFEKVRGSWLFGRQVRFAELTTTEVTPENAAHLHAMAQELLHFSPEARVVEKLIESAELLGRGDEAAAYRLRYRAAFPAAYAQWVKAREPL